MKVKKLKKVSSLFFTKELDKINQYYNQNYKDLGDTVFPTYRKVFVTLPKGISSIPKELTIQKKETNTQKKVIFINMVIDFLTSTIKNEKEYNKLKDEIINEKIKLKREIKTTKMEINNYTDLLNQITNSKFYKIWQLYRNFKKALNI